MFKSIDIGHSDATDTGLVNSWNGDEHHLIVVSCKQDINSPITRRNILRAFHNS
jgi:hypothetical protein